MKRKIHYVALSMHQWKNLAPPVIYEGRAIGFMPVFRSLKDLRADHPESEYQDRRKTVQLERGETDLMRYWKPLRVFLLWLSDRLWRWPHKRDAILDYLYPDDCKRTFK